ncbi:MAG: PilZ domain-containing protein, partial [Candidatus Eiseniibacteriota bacterium]
MPQKRAARRSERRRSARADAKLSMRVEGRHLDGDSTQVVTESQNISANGVYCTSTHYLSPLSKVALTIVLPRLPGSTASKELIKCDGIVVRCEPGPGKRSEKQFELACMFSDLDERRRGLLEEFVTWRNLQALRAAAN